MFVLKIRTAEASSASFMSSMNLGRSTGSDSIFSSRVPNNKINEPCKDNEKNEITSNSYLVLHYFWHNCLKFGQNGEIFFKNKSIQTSLTGKFHSSSFSATPLHITFCRFVWTPVSANSWALNSIGSSSVLTVTSGKFSRPHFTFTTKWDKQEFHSSKCVPDFRAIFAY